MVDDRRRWVEGWHARTHGRGARDAVRARILAELSAVGPDASDGSTQLRAAVKRRETLYRPVRPIDVRRTLSPLHRGDSNPCFRIDRRSGDVWLTTRLPQGPATLVIRPVREGARAVAFGPGADAAIEAVPELLGAGDDWRELWDLLDRSGTPGWLRETARRNPGLRLTRTGTLLEHLVPAVLEQRVTTVEAHRAIAVLHARYGEPAPGPPELVPDRLRLPLTAAQWLAIPAWEWHRAGVDASRSRTVTLAARTASSLERLAQLPREAGAQARRTLRSLQGIGEWTAAETVQRTLGDPDAPSFGDDHLAAQVGWAFTGADTDDDGLRELLAPWPGHRQRVVRLVQLSGRDRPRRGPRVAGEEHRNH